MLLGVGAKKSSVFVDDVFSTYLWEGTGSARSINNGIDLSGEGGMVWIKNRSAGDYHGLFDTLRGDRKYVQSNATNSEEVDSASLVAFNNNGFNLGTGNDDMIVNNSNEDFSSWTFRKAPGFFDVVTYNGDSGAPNWGTSDIPHNLGCIPGLIILKKTNASGGWWVYHRDLPATTNAAWSKVLRLDSDGAEQTAYNLGTASYHTATTFRVGNDNSSNNTGDSYVAYLFAGGESTAATARSVDFDGSGDDLRWASSADFAMGTGDFTFECWVKPSNWSSTYMTVFCVGSGSNTGGLWIGKNQSNFVVRSFSVADYIQTTTFPTIGQWTHVAVTRSGTTLKLFYNGIEQKSVTNSYDFQGGDDIWVSNDGYNNRFVGKISNLRLVKGTAVYTSSFRPPTEPLTNITNTKVLCCNNSSVTGSTVTPGTITANGDPTASSDSPFDDPAAFTFGDAGDQNVIKCGSYKGSSSADFEVNLGWEPQWIIFKRTDGSANWSLFDSMRGIVTGGNENYLYPNLTNAEYSAERISLTPTGFIVDASAGVLINENGGDYIYIAIRSATGTMTRPPELGTDVFAMDTGNGSSTIPVFDSGFPVDFALLKQTNSSNDWYTTGRLISGKYVYTNSNAAEASFANFTFDSNVGWSKNPNNTDWQSWMWKRHAGFEFQAYNGVSGTSSRPHSMNAVPEMIWAKRTIYSENWVVYHKGLNGGTNPHQYYLKLNTNDAEVNANQWNAQPTSTHWFTAAGGLNNNADQPYIAMLFASVDGISKCGTYDGSGSTGNAQNIGFQPRFLLIKRISSTGDWMQFNSAAGFGNYMQLNTSQGQNSQTYVSVSSTGFSLVSDYGDTNESGSSYIYYAHA